MRLCKDCKFAKRPFLAISYEFARCTHPSAFKHGKTDPVTGKTRNDNSWHCSTERKEFGICKPEGINFVAK